MTFSLPCDLAAQFFARVPARERSRYRASALIDKLADRDRKLSIACDIANADSDLLAIEAEFDALNDDFTEPSPATSNSPDAKSR